MNFDENLVNPDEEREYSFEPLKITDMNLTVGQKVWIAPKYNQKDGILEETEVETVGRKYFTLKGWKGDKFYNSDGKRVTQYNNVYQVYLTKKEYDEKVEGYNLSISIRTAINKGGYGRLPYTLDQLKMLEAILKEPIL